MAKLFNFSQYYTAEELDAMRNECRGIYWFDLKYATPERLSRACKGYSADTLAALVGHCRVFVRTYRDEDTNGARAVVLPETFPRNVQKAIKRDNRNGASFRFNAIAAAYPYDGANAMSHGVVCLECGKVFSTAPTRHVCDAPSCRSCGCELTSEEAKYGQYCTACAAARVEHVYRYHGRCGRSSPRFEKPEKRATELHGGVEVEYAGSEFFYACDSHAKGLSRAINDSVLTPFFEFECDASIDNGIECISAPTTYNGFKKRLSNIAAMYEYARNNGAMFGRLNGLHVHLDRRFFNKGGGTKDVKTAQLFIELLVYKYFDFFKLISHRERDAFHYASKKEGVDDVVTAAFELHDQEHSYAVNGSGSNTIELRIFGGHITTAAEMLAVVDIAQALARWAKSTTISAASKATPLVLINYLRDAANVREFMRTIPRNAAHTDDADALLSEFNAKLDEKMTSREGQ